MIDSNSVHNLSLIHIFGAQRGLGKADGDYAVQVVAIALEEFMLPDSEHHIEIARGRAGSPSVAFAGVADAGRCV